MPQPKSYTNQRLYDTLTITLKLTEKNKEIEHLFLVWIPQKQIYRFTELVRFSPKNIDTTTKCRC